MMDKNVKTLNKDSITNRAVPSHSWSMRQKEKSVIFIFSARNFALIFIFKNIV